MVHLKGFSPITLTQMNVTPFCFQKEGLPYLKLSFKKNSEMGTQATPCHLTS
jgi:hypothetical protein